MSFDNNTEIAMWNYKENEKSRLHAQEQEFDGLPKAITVTYIGDNSNGFSHKGRSRFRSNDPYWFYPGKPVLVKDPVDVKYFYKVANKEMFSVEIVNEAEIIAKSKNKPTINSDFEDQKAQAEKIMKEQKEEVVEAEVIAEVVEQEIVEEVEVEAKVVEQKVEEPIVEESEEVEEQPSLSASDVLSDIGLSLKIRNRIIEAGFDEVEKLSNANLDDLISIDGVGQVTAEKIKSVASEKL